MFETKKNIEIIRNIDLDDIRKVVNENIETREIYYTDVYLPDLSQYYDIDIVGKFELEGFEEIFTVNRINEARIDVFMTTDNENIETAFGMKEKVSFYIENRSKRILNISSFELELPKILKLMEMDVGSDMESLPGMALGMYMWTAGPYAIEPGQKYNLSFIVGANAKGEEEIKFRITTGNMYIEGPGIKVLVK